MIFRVILFAFLGFLLFRGLRQLLGTGSGQNMGSKGAQASGMGQRSPYDILGVTRGSDSEEIKKAYRDLLAEYHPDKVEHLGEELKELAKQKTQEISWAYDQLK